MKHRKPWLFPILLTLLTVLLSGCGGNKVTAGELLEKCGQVSGFRAIVTEEMTLESGGSSTNAVYEGNLEFTEEVRHIKGSFKLGKREHMPEYYVRKTPGEEDSLDIYYYKKDDDIWKIEQNWGELQGIGAFLGNLQSVELRPYEKDASEYVILAETDLVNVIDFGMTVYTGSGFSSVLEALAGTACPMHAELTVNARTGLLKAADFVLIRKQEVQGKTVSELHIRLDFTDMTLKDLQIPEEIIGGAF